MRIYKSALIDFIAAVTMMVLIHFSGYWVADVISYELPDIDSDFLSRYLPEGDVGIDLSNLEDTPNLFSSFTLYTLAAVDSSVSRNFSPDEDFSLFLSIVTALPKEEGEITMFRFGADDTVEIDFESSTEVVEEFCNSLAKTGRFTTVFYSPVSNNNYTIYTTISN